MVSGERTDEDLATRHDADLDPRIRRVRGNGDRQLNLHDEFLQRIQGCSRGFGIGRLRSGACVKPAVSFSRASDADALAPSR